MNARVNYESPISSDSKVMNKVTFFSAPEPKAQVRYICIVITHCLSLLTTFHIFDFFFWLLLRNCSMEFNKTWQEARSQRPLPSLCFSAESEKQDGRPGLGLA